MSNMSDQMKIKMWYGWCVCFVFITFLIILLCPVRIVHTSTGYYEQSLCHINYPINVRFIDDEQGVRYLQGKSLLQKVEQKDNLTCVATKPLYAGADVDTDALQVLDCNKHIISIQLGSFEVPVGDDVVVESEYGSLLVKNVEILKPVSLHITYFGGKPGDSFSKNNVHVFGTYSDGVVKELSWFDLVDEPTNLTESFNLTCDTRFGRISDKIDLSIDSNLKITYDGTIYEGQSIDLSRVHVQLILADGTILDAPEVKVCTDICINYPIDIYVMSSFGSGWLHLDPIKLTNVVLDTSDSNFVENSVLPKGILLLMYADGREVKISDKDWSYLNSSSRLHVGKQTVYVKTDYGIQSIVLNGIPEEIADLRRQAYKKAPRYSLSDDTCNTLAVLIRRLVGDDMLRFQDMLSLLANQYEATHKEYSGDKLLMFAYDTDFFGKDAKIYASGVYASEDSLYLCQDVLCNGYRSLDAKVMSLDDIHTEPNDDTEIYVQSVSD